MPWSVSGNLARPLPLEEVTPKPSCLQLFSEVRHQLMAVSAVRRMRKPLPAGRTPRRRAALADRRVERLLRRGAAVVALDLADHLRAAHSAIALSRLARSFGSSTQVVPGR